MKTLIVRLMAAALCSIVFCSCAAQGGAESVRAPQEKKVRVGLYVDSGASGNGLFHLASLIEHSPQTELVTLLASDIRAGKLKEIDILVMPGGGSTTQCMTIGLEHHDKIRDFLRNGGGYVGTCAGMFNVLQIPKRLHLLPFSRHGGAGGSTSYVTVNITPEGAKILGIKPGPRKVRYSGGPVAYALKDAKCEGKGIALATFKDAVCKKPHHVGKFMGSVACVYGTFGKGKVVVEEFLIGPEFSFMCFVDGNDVYPMTLSQDHKRAYEGDKGPNTGGMGAYSPVPIITDEDLEFSLEKVMKPTAAAMVSEGCPFTGVLYGGLMKTPQGPKVIEFNCRFGDPETEVVLPRLATDIYDIFSAVADHTPMPAIEWKKEVTMGFVMASKGYPGSYDKGYEIDLSSVSDASPVISSAPTVISSEAEGRVEKSPVRIYHMGTSLKDGKYYTSGGRVLMVVGFGADLQEAHDKALAAVESIKCENLFYRRDIGWRVL